MPYCHEMEAAYAAADLVLCRAGASTVSELMVVKKPALLIPYPYATAGHQMDNARVLTNAGVARVIEQKKLNGDRFWPLIHACLDPSFLDAAHKNFAKIKEIHSTAAVTIRDQLVAACSRS